MTETTQVVVVTGGNGALGSGLVAELVASGSRVVSVERARGAHAVERLSDTTWRVATDVTEARTLSQALEAAAREAGDLTGAALTAGAWRGGAPLHESLEQSELETLWSANVVPVEVALRALLPGFVARRAGSVVLVGSRSAVRPWTAPGDAQYGATKAAVVALAQAAAAEVLSHGVRVNCVLPSTIDTPANRAAMPDADTARWVSVASLAGVIRFLLSDASRDVSGAAIPVYGRVGV